MRLDAGFGARGAVGMTAWAFFATKAAALALVLLDDFAFVAVGAFLAGFAADLLVVGLVGGAGALAARLTKTAPRASTAAGLALLFTGAIVSLWAVINVYAIMCFGSPLTHRMLTYSMGLGKAAGMMADVPVRTTIAVGVVWLVVAPFAAYGADRLLRRARPQRLAAALAVYVVCAGAASVLARDVVAAYGLDRNAVTSIVGTTILHHVGDAPAEGKLVVPYDAPPKPPRERDYTEDVRWNRDAPRPKHVVLWFAESIGTRYTQLYGAEHATTPNLVRLKGKSLRFDRYYANQPISIQAIFGALCGMYPYPDNKFITLVNPRIACPSIMETLTSQGWRAALFHGGIFGFTDKLKFLGERGFDVMYDGENMPGAEKWWSNGWGIDDASLVEQGLAWLDQKPGSPSLSVYIPLFPHHDYFLPPKAPRPFGARDEFSKYLNGVAYTDMLFGRLYDEYEKRGLADDTLFVFVGDHGEAFGQHPRNKLHGSFVYEENVHAPLVFVNGRLFEQELVSGRLGSHVDLVATILDLVGQPNPEGSQGQSLVSSSYKYRPVLLGAYWQDKIHALRDGRWKYLRNETTGVDELYDLHVDAMEKVNVAGARPDLVDDYAARLRDFEVRQKQHIEKFPSLGATYTARLVKGMSVSIAKPDGTVVACDQERRGGGLQCPGEPAWMYAAVETVRSFNIARECVRVHPPAEGKLVVRFDGVAPAPKVVGVGIDDTKRRAGGAPIKARVTVGAQEPFELVVADPFMQNYRARAVAGGADATSVVIEIESADPQNRTTCLSLSP